MWSGLGEAGMTETPAHERHAAFTRNTPALFALKLTILIHVKYPL